MTDPRRPVYAPKWFVIGMMVLFCLPVVVFEPLWSVLFIPIVVYVLVWKKPWTTPIWYHHGNTKPRGGNMRPPKFKKPKGL